MKREKLMLDADMATPQNNENADEDEEEASRKQKKKKRKKEKSRRSEFVDIDDMLRIR